MASLFIIDDDTEIRNVLRDHFEEAGYDVESYTAGEKAYPEVLSKQPDIILLDMMLPGMDGLTFLKKVQGKLDATEIVMITGHADYHSAVQAIKLGARDFIKKPFGVGEISLVIEKVLEEGKKNLQLRYLNEAHKNRASDMVGTSPIMQDVYQFIEQVAQSSKTSVLITGETGTGKGMAARSIHYASPRADMPFVEVNCSAFQTSLLESELFGHEAGSFTGAKTRKKGLFELGNSGTFFLDEVGDMSLELQAKLLKVLEEQTFRRVGGTKEIHVDTRIISATSRNLTKMVERGAFRPDLFYRLNVATIELPPLRDRQEDILVLADHYMGIFTKEFKKNLSGMDRSTKALLLGHPWVGNVRELRNVIERAVLFEKGETLSPESVGLQVEQPGNDLLESGFHRDPMNFIIPEEGISLEMVEKRLILEAMQRTRGNKTRAARLLDLSLDTLKYRLKKYHFNDEQI